MLCQFQRLLIRPVINPPSDWWRRRHVLIRVLHVNLFIFVLIPIVRYPVRRSWPRSESGSLTLLVCGTTRSWESGRVVTHQLTDHPEGARFSLRLLRRRFQPVDPLWRFVKVGVSARGVSDDRAERATFAAHAGDGAAGRTLADFHSGRTGVRLLLLRRRRLRLRRWRGRWWRAL